MRGCSAFSHDFGTDGGAVEIYARNGITIEGTRIHNNWSCSNSGFLEIGGTDGGGIRDTVISYNVTRNSGLFLCMHLGGTFGSEVSGVRIEHNTVVETGEGRALMAFVGGAPTAGTLNLRNNIFDVGNYSLFTNREGFAHSHNLYHLRAQATQLGFVLNAAAGEKMGDPRFVDAAAQDYRLQPDSPAIDGGMDLGYPLDHAGTSLFSGDTPDMGAYEHIPQAEPSPSPTATETPAPPTATVSPTMIPAPRPLPRPVVPLRAFLPLVIGL
ncbi:MAG TPA: hypothetical protein GX702_08355 [Chloroflexi bacterium]|jgi:hypothetical protein|nr:hypothetical protein [Chloroflexota bacterium]